MDAGVSQTPARQALAIAREAASCFKTASGREIGRSCGLFGDGIIITERESGSGFCEHSPATDPA
eukprot:CAMPEP_0180015432 /NCGR_PEP_ID=MMETSP0984-20121128/18738_1 /TAXON_ID=483367 /ORGANISM="non described non described, Strain CCMP 2436" /LENGTH=64 /DNA_ID=CAMNT_0021938235 /DNA_START=576 /DNA_END=766 /DNA_ORIENTATION=+